MEIVVLLKQVPSTESYVQIDSDGKSIKTDDIKWIINPYDELAVEEALRIKKDHGATVTILTLGSEKSVEAIRTALAMGADKAIRIDMEGVETDGLGISKILAKVLEDTPYDLIIAGHRAVDDDNYQVGPAVAEFLNIPNISMVIKEEIKDNTITCDRTVEGGTVVISAKLPALITTQRGLNEPRYASLPGIMKAKRKPIEVKKLSDLGISADSLVSKVVITSLSEPPQRSGGRLIEGETAEEKAANLVKALKEEAKVL